MPTLPPLAPLQPILPQTYEPMTPLSPIGDTTMTPEQLSALTTVNPNLMETDEELIQFGQQSGLYKPEELLQIPNNPQMRNELREKYRESRWKKLGLAPTNPLPPSQTPQPPPRPYDPTTDKGGIQLLSQKANQAIPRQWIENHWTPEQIARGFAVLQEQEKLRGIQGINPRDADFFGAANVAQRLPDAPGGMPGGALPPLGDISRFNPDQQAQLLAGEQSIKDIQNLRFNGAAGINTPRQPAPQPPTMPPDAFSQMIAERGPSITTSGQVIPRGISTPGVRQMPMGLGEEGYNLTDSRQTWVPGAPRTPDELEAGGALAFQNLIDKRGYARVDKPSNGVSAIRDPEQGWIQSSEVHSIPQEVLDRRQAYDQEAKFKAANKAAAAQGGLTQRGKREAFARHQKMGTATPDELVALLQGLGKDGNVDYTDPAMAGFFPGMAQAQLANGQLANDTRDSMARANRFGAEADAIRSGSAARNPEAMGGPLNDDPIEDSVFGQLPSAQDQSQLDKVPGNTPQEFFENAPTNAMKGDAGQNYIKKRFGEKAYRSWKAEKQATSRKPVKGQFGEVQSYPGFGYPY